MRRTHWLALALACLAIGLVSPSIANSFYVSDNGVEAWRFTAYPIQYPSMFVTWIGYSLALFGSVVIGARALRNYGLTRGALNAWFGGAIITAISFNAMEILTFRPTENFGLKDALEVGFLDHGVLWQHGVIGLMALGLATLVRRQINRSPRLDPAETAVGALASHTGSATVGNETEDEIRRGDLRLSA